MVQEAARAAFVQKREQLLARRTIHTWKEAATQLREMREAHERQVAALRRCFVGAQQLINPLSITSHFAEVVLFATLLKCTFALFVVILLALLQQAVINDISSLQ